jgi:hypothetical protein
MQEGRYLCDRLEGDASGTNGNSPSPYNLLTERPLPEEKRPSSGGENGASKSSFRSLAMVFVSAGGMKSNHGFTGLSGE